MYPRKIRQRIARTLGALTIAVACSLLATESRADYPSYMIVRTPTAKAGEHPSQGYTPGYAYGGSTNGYSYGWFGAPPRQHWSRHFGTYRNYTQWKSK